MSEENVKAVRDAAAAFNRGDLDTASASRPMRYRAAPFVGCRNLLQRGSWWAAFPPWCREPKAFARIGASAEINLCIADPSDRAEIRAAVDTLQLGHSDIEIAPLGVGAMSWANRSVMSYGGADSPQEEARALQECLAAGVTLLDTAEACSYGGESPSGVRARPSDLARARRRPIG